MTRIYNLLIKQNMEKLKMITIILFFVLISCNTDEQKMIKAKERINGMQILQKERAIKDSIARIKDSVDMAFKSTPEYIRLEKKSNKIILKFEKIIKNAYNKNEDLFYMDKYENSMLKYNFKKGTHTGDYKGDYKGHRISIRMLATRPSSSGWVHKFVISCDDFDSTLTL